MQYFAKISILTLSGEHDYFTCYTCSNAEKYYKDTVILQLSSVLKADESEEHLREGYGKLQQHLESSRNR